MPKVASSAVEYIFCILLLWMLKEKRDQDLDERAENFKLHAEKVSACFRVKQCQQRTEKQDDSGS